MQHRRSTGPTGAEAAGDGAALILQQTAARAESAQRATLLGQQVDLRHQLAAALTAAGITQTVSSGQVSQFEGDVELQERPAGHDHAGPPALRGRRRDDRPGHDPGDRAGPRHAVAGTLPDEIDSGGDAQSGLNATLAGASAALQSLAGVDLSVTVAARRPRERAGPADDLGAARRPGELSDHRDQQQPARRLGGGPGRRLRPGGSRTWPGRRPSSTTARRPPPRASATSTRP